MENADHIASQGLVQGRQIDLNVKTVRQVYFCGNPKCPKNHYIPSEGPYTGQIWTSLSLFPRNGDEWSVSIKDTCRQPMTRSTNHLVNEQNVRLYKIEGQSNKTYINIPAGQNVQWSRCRNAAPGVGDFFQ